MISKCKGGFEHNLKPMGKFRQCLRCNIVITQPEEYDYDCKICKDEGWLNIVGWTGDRCVCNPEVKSSCESHVYTDREKYKTVGYSYKPDPKYKKPYIVEQCKDCEKFFIQDEAGIYYEHTTKVYPMEKS